MDVVADFPYDLGWFLKLWSLLRLVGWLRVIFVLPPQHPTSSFHNFGSDFGFRISGRWEAQVTWNSRETSGVAVDWLPRLPHGIKVCIHFQELAGSLRESSFQLVENVIEFSRNRNEWCQVLGNCEKITNSRFCCFLSRKVSGRSSPETCGVRALGCQGCQGWSPDTYPIQRVEL